jgi:hypothetical protein
MAIFKLVENPWMSRQNSAISYGCYCNGFPDTYTWFFLRKFKPTPLPHRRQLKPSTGAPPQFSALRHNLNDSAGRKFAGASAPPLPDHLDTARPVCFTPTVNFEINRFPGGWRYFRRCATPMFQRPSAVPARRHRSRAASWKALPTGDNRYSSTVRCPSLISAVTCMPDAKR